MAPPGAVAVAVAPVNPQVPGTPRFAPVSRAPGRPMSHDGRASSSRECPWTFLGSPLPHAGGRGVCSTVVVGPFETPSNRWDDRAGNRSAKPAGHHAWLR